MIYTHLMDEDLQQLLDISEQMHQEAPHFKNKKFDRSKMSKILLATKTHSNRMFLTYSKNNGVIEGGILGRISEQYFSDELTASDMAMFVKPEHRGSILFVRLFKNFEKWSKDNKATSIVIGHTTGINMDKVQGMYTRLGYNSMGYVFNKEIA